VISVPWAWRVVSVCCIKQKAWISVCI